LETTKPYLMNTLRMPAAQTTLLFAHTIDTNVTMSRIVCDSWLLLEFPLPETGQALLLKASNLRRTWNKLLELKLKGLNMNVDDELGKVKTEKTSEELEYELWQNLAMYMNTELCYTLKRLLPGDMKVINQLFLYFICIHFPVFFSDNLCWTL
jgi:ATP-dependent RNA helicase DHX34